MSTGRPRLALLLGALVALPGCFSSHRVAHLAYVSTRHLDAGVQAPEHWVHGEACGGTKLLKRAIDATLEQEPGASGLVDARLEERDEGFHVCYGVTARPVVPPAPAPSPP